MKEKNYSAGLMSQSLWFTEFKKVMELLNEGKTPNEIRTAAVEQNIFGAAREYRAKRMGGYLTGRAAVFDAKGIRLFCESDIKTQKIMTIIALMKYDRLFFEFVYEVYRAKLSIGIEKIAFSDVSRFLSDKAEQSEKVAGFSDSAIKHLRSNYTNFLQGSDLLGEKKKGANPTWQITPPLISSELENYMAGNNESIYIDALTGANGWQILKQD